MDAPHKPFPASGRLVLPASNLYLRRWILRARDLAVLAAIGSLALAPLARAARLTNVVPTDGGCISGPTGPSTQFWDVQPGKTYRLTITNVTECGNSGTDATIGVRLNSTGTGNTDLVATNAGVGIYTFSFTIPANAACTFVIFYCTTPGQGNTGLMVTRNDGGKFQAHLRASTFGPACTSPTPINTCVSTAVLPSTWGSLKTHYR